MAGNIVLLAASAQSQEGIVVLHIPGVADPTDPEFADILTAQLDATGLAKELSVEPVSLPAGDGVKVSLVLDLATTPSASAELHETIYFIRVGVRTWAIDGISASGAGDLFDRIANTFAVSA